MQQARLASRAADDEIPSGETIVARAQALIPVLRARAEDVELQRRIPEATIQDFHDAGFFKILQPTRWGGWDMDAQVFYKVLMEIGRGCGSSAWVLMVLGLHQWEFGLFPQEAGDDIWATDNTVLASSSYPPMTVCRRVEGGWRISGRWPTSSGVDHAGWAIIGGFVRNEAGAVVDKLNLLVPRRDFTVIDDWQVFGLAGTGSKSLEVNDAFVPDHRVHTAFDMEIPNRSRSAQLPFKMIFYGAVASAINGMAAGAVDIYREQMSGRVATGTGEAAALSPYVKDRLGNAVARVRSSRVRLLQMLADAYRAIDDGSGITEDMVVHALLDIARVGREAEEATLLLYKATSARGVFLSNPIQRVLRNVLAGANHITQNADDTAGLLGGYLLGQPLPPMFLYRRPQTSSKG